MLPCFSSLGVNVLPTLGSKDSESSQPHLVSRHHLLLLQLLLTEGPMSFLGSCVVGVGSLWGREAPLILREVRKCMLPLSAEEGRRRSGCLWKPSFLFFPWLYWVARMLVLKLMEGENYVWRMACVVIDLELAKNCSRLRGKKSAKHSIFPS